MNFFQKAYDWLAGFGKYLKDMILDVFNKSFKKFLKVMGPIITEILLDIQKDPSIITDDDRRNAAYKKVVKEAKKAGVDLVEKSLIFFAIEFILNSIKSRGDMPKNVTK